MPESATGAWNKLFERRGHPLRGRFPGIYRAEVVETNDPLNMGRIRFRCPELHDSDLKEDDCPWAVPALDLGSSGSGRFTSPCKGDRVWIAFEKNHPYGPVWIGVASPTRRAFYPLPAVHQTTPIPLDETGKQLGQQREDFDKDYLPKDGRPMSHGWTDRYGNLDMSSSVGFFPSEHVKPPPPPDHDALQGAAFKQQQDEPEVNKPDRKYMVRVSKYGNMCIQADQGYSWKKETGGGVGEFTGNFKQDEKFETKRWLYLQKLFNEDVADSTKTNGDQRRIADQTRYGHLWEMRDVGWAQLGPKPSKSRPDEFGPPCTLSKERTNDFRWVKARSGAGFLLQAMDMGADPAENVFIKKTLLERAGQKSEQEDQFWANRDARQWRLVTPHGIKVVLDDRGSDSKDPAGKELPRANGVLWKGRRSPGSKGNPSEGDPKGFFWEFNENDQANHTMWGTPLGLTLEMNDRYQYLLLTGSLGPGWPRGWMGLKENEFNRKPGMMNDPETNSHHLKIDHENEYVRLKTRAAKGPRPLNGVVQPGVLSPELNQGLEARDGANGQGPWVELVDCQHRGMWWSRKQQLGIWRAQQAKQLYVWMMDGDTKKQIVIQNREVDGMVEIYCASAVNIITDQDATIQGARNINMRSGQFVNIDAGGTLLTIGGGRIQTNGVVLADQVRSFFPGCFPGPGAGSPQPGGQSVIPLTPQELPLILEPDDRGKTYNGPFEECPQSEVEHPIQ